MPQTPVTSDALQALEVVGDLATQVTLYHDFIIYDIVTNQT
jgi:hypothetical protein